MSGRGELVTNQSPFEGISRALGGVFGVETAGPGEIAVRDDLDKLVCRISVLSVLGGSWWLTLMPLRGYEQDADRIRRLLIDDGYTTEDDWKSPQVPMKPRERADVVAARVLRRLLQVQDANLPGTLADADPEFLHDYRVAIRRARSVLREFKRVFNPDDLEQVRSEFKWLQEQTSATRDLDVYLQDFQQLRARAPEAMRDDLDPLLSLLRARRRTARAAMEKALTGERARALHVEWVQILEVLVLESEQDRPDAARAIAEVTAVRVRKVHRKMLKMGRAITPASPPEDYHELRKKGKELRYLLELFAAPLFDPDVVKPLIKTLKGLQDVLGLHQDREVQIEMLRELAQEVASQRRGPGTLMAIGALIERLEADAADARGHFAASFAEFASEAQCKLIADEFR